MYYDLLIRIKNAQKAKKESLTAPFSNMDMAVAKVLADAGYIKSASKKEVGKKNYLEIKLAYPENGPAITDFRVMSKPSRRLYSSYKELKPVKQNMGMSVLSTPQGIMSNKEARKNKIGGEFLFEVW